MKTRIIILMTIICFFQISFADDFVENFSRVPDSEGETYISGFDFSNEKVTYSVFGDVAVYAGDIILGDIAELEERREMYENNDTNLSKSFVKLGKTVRWKNGIVLYSIDTNMPNENRQILYDAINEWETYTVIRFQEVTEYQKSIGEIYQKFLYVGPCQSTTGRIYGAYTEMKKCSVGGLIHEIGHVVGLFHEQQRYDRDQYIDILWENVNPYYKKQFNTFGNENNIIRAYDYNSVMHYSAYSASKNSHPTMVAKNGATLGNNRLSVGDIQTVNEIYSIHIATMISPASGSQLNSTSSIFHWTDTYGDAVYIRVIDSNNNVLYSKSHYGQYASVNNLPSDGSEVKVTLTTNTIDGNVVRNYTYTAYLAKPSKPSNLLTSDISFNSVTLKWSDNTTTEQGYRVYRGSTLIATLSANSTSYKINNLKDDTDYTFTIKAFNNTGESSPVTITFKTKQNLGWMIPVIYYPLLLIQ